MLCCRVKKIEIYCTSIADSLIVPNTFDLTTLGPYTVLLCMIMNGGGGHKREQYLRNVAVSMASIVSHATFQNIPPPLIQTYTLYLGKTVVPNY